MNLRASGGVGGGGCGKGRFHRIGCSAYRRATSGGGGCGLHPKVSVEKAG